MANQFMQRALELAQLAEQYGEVPVGAVLVYHDKIIAEGFNQVITQSDPTAHAEIITMRSAGQIFDNYRLLDCDLYVTLEPCMMCTGAMVHARLRKLIYAASDPKTGCINSCGQYLQSDFHNHKVDVEAGVCAEQSSALLKDFFKAKRKNAKALDTP